MARMHYIKRWYEIQATYEILTKAGYTFDSIYALNIENVYYITEETFKKTIYERKTNGIQEDEKAMIKNRVFTGLVCRRFINRIGEMVLD